VVEVGVGGVRAVVRDSGERAGGVAEVRWGEPVVGVGEVLADTEAEAAFAGCRSPDADDVLLGAGGCGVPAWLVSGVPHVEVVVVDAHGEEVLCAGFDVEVHEVFGIPAGGFELGDEVFVADFGGVAVGLDVVVVLSGALHVHVAGVPVAVFDGGLRSPVGPDAELGVGEPGREAIGLE
jgi:hypothetical protein